MDTPIFELPRCLSEGIECSRRPQENTFQPDGEGFDGFGRCAGLSIDLDDVRGVPWAVVLSEAGHSALLQLFDPLDLSLETVADIDSETGVLGVKDVPLWATLESVSVGFDEVFESIDPTVELSYLGHVIVFSLFDCFEQRFGDALQGVGVEIGAAVEDISS